jgi:LuxR family transcriptional regulator, maltose regulon positive regulatory protein
VLVGTGQLHYEQDALDAAEQELTEGIRLVEPTGEIGILVEAYVTLARLKRAKGDGEGALEAARTADRLARASSVPQAKAKAASWMVRLRIAGGDFEAALWEQERALNPGGETDSARISQETTRARLLLARGEREGALRLLYRIQEEAEAVGRNSAVIETLTLRAIALWSKNEKQRAVSALAQALAAAEPEGYVRTFVDEGPPMTDLLTAVLEARWRGRLDYPARVPARYLARLLAVLAKDAGTRDAEGLPEPLSEREAEVLALISAGRSNQEIAEELFVTLSTVKSHANSLFGKLGVRNRTQAVARAREMNLL